MLFNISKLAEVFNFHIFEVHKFSIFFNFLKFEIFTIMGFFNYSCFYKLFWCYFEKLWFYERHRLFKVFWKDKGWIKGSGNTSIVLKWLCYLKKTNLQSFNTIVPPLPVYNLLPDSCKALYTISASTSVDVQQWPPYSTNNLLSCVVMCPSQWFFHFGKEITITWTHIGCVCGMFQYLPLPAVREILESISSMRPCTVMKDDRVHCHLVSSLSPECWMKMITQETAVAGSVYCLSRFSMVQYHSISVICHNEHRLHITLCRAHFLWITASLLPFSCRFKRGSYERAQVPSRVSILPRTSSSSFWYWCNKSCAIA
jgi:hypothetical protein